MTWAQAMGIGLGVLALLALYGALVERLLGN
jgi:hypothetical protein